ncbi:MAG TPA: hypothetical protein VNK43_04945 [Gemmatimonadales bacterium]|nr:hypothetical protein [Gemmatimonadales bacterium]
MSSLPQHPWESDGEFPWESSPEPWADPPQPWAEEADEPWRGQVHLPDWPEELAGPEYWLFKRYGDDER